MSGGNGWIVVAGGWLILILLLAGVGAVIWLGIDSVVRGWRALDAIRRDLAEREADR